MKGYFVSFANPFAELLANVRREMDQCTIVQLPAIDIVMVILKKSFDRAFEHWFPEFSMECFCEAFPK